MTAGFPSAGATFPESAHPYANNFDFTWVYQSGVAATHLDVTFDPQTLLGAGDRIHILDTFGVEIDGSPFTGNSLAGATKRVPGANLQIRLVSDGADTAWGFKITNIVPLNIPAPDLMINKSHTGIFKVGEIRRYTIEIRNIGTGPTSGPVTVTDTLPAGMTAVSIGGEGWTCVQPGGPCQQTEILFNRASYPQLFLEVQVGPQPSGTVVNTAQVTGGGDSNSSNNTALDYTEIESTGPDLRIVKSHTGNFSQGQTGGTYTIQVSNVGQAPSVGTVNVTDTVPAGLTATSINGNGWTCVQPAGPCARTDALLVGQTYPDIILTVNVAPDAPSQVTNVAKVTGVGDFNSVNDTANDHTTIVVSGADLRITKTHAGNFTQSQQGATYTIEVRNHGTQPTSGEVTVTETLPADLTAVSINGTGWDCTQPSGPCTRSDVLPVNTSYPPLTLTVNVANNAHFNVVNSVTVSGGGDTDPSNNTATDPTTIAGNPTCDPLPESSHPYANNFDFTWTCLVPGNPGLVNVSFDPQTSLQAGDFIHITDANGTHIPGSPFTGLSLAGQTKSVPGNTAIIRLVTNASGQDWGFKINNVVGAAAGSTDLSITKTHSGNFTQAQNGAQYTILVHNGGTAASSGTVTVTDTVPAGMVATSINGNGWNCVQPAGPCTRSDSLGVGQNFPAITLTVNVAANAPDMLTNTATVSGGGDTNPANNIATDPTEIKPPIATCTPGIPESTHPYENGVDQLWTCVQSGNPSSINVSFDPQTLLDETDFLYVMDKNGNNIPGSPFTGASLAGATKNILGDTVKIRLLTDLRRAAWGFKVTGIASVASSEPDVTITKTHTGNFVFGQNGATYTIVVKNIGGGPTAGVITVQDNVPAGLNPVSINGPGWNCTQPAGPCTRNDVLPPGGSYPPLTLTVNVAGGAPAQVTNTATVTAAPDFNPGNNTASDPTMIVSGGGCTLAESPHPYENNYDQTWVCTIAGNPASLNVTFDPQTRIDTTDLLYVTTGADVNIPGSPFTGATLAGQTVNVPGSTVKIRFVTDGRRTDWGFKVTNIVGAP